MDERARQLYQYQLAMQQQASQQQAAAYQQAAQQQMQQIYQQQLQQQQMQQQMQQGQVILVPQEQADQMQAQLQAQHQAQVQAYLQAQQQAAQQQQQAAQTQAQAQYAQLAQQQYAQQLQAYYAQVAQQQEQQLHQQQQQQEQQEQQQTEAPKQRKSMQNGSRKKAIRSGSKEVIVLDSDEETSKKETRKKAQKQGAPNVPKIKKAKKSKAPSTSPPRKSRLYPSLKVQSSKPLEDEGDIFAEEKPKPKRKLLVVDVANGVTETVTSLESLYTAKELKEMKELAAKEEARENLREAFFGDDGDKRSVCSVGSGSTQSSGHLATPSFKVHKSFDATSPRRINYKLKSYYEALARIKASKSKTFSNNVTRKIAHTATVSSSAATSLKKFDLDSRFSNATVVTNAPDSINNIQVDDHDAEKWPRFEEPPVIVI
mmetsp:Transcript_13437/g.15614  ORF Transcript_13437/g.15614 Transcript_13437/m.15614 type:complete len:430 (+) Transcript_13437:330-1619(+)